jgi:glucan phosphoethanolaminetransferase (alkaline phosphatase superfamily)
MVLCLLSGGLFVTLLIFIVIDSAHSGVISTTSFTLCCFILFDFVKIYNYINARIFRQLFSAIKQEKRPSQAVFSELR